MKRLILSCYFFLFCFSIAKASGTYFYVLRVNDFVDVKKMVLLK